MPWKLLAFIVTMSLVLVFVGFNLENNCDISIVFISFRQVPVVITILSSFVLGLLAAFFLSLGRGHKGGRGMAPRVGGVDGALEGDSPTKPSAGGKKPRARAKKSTDYKPDLPGSLDTQ